VPDLELLILGIFAVVGLAYCLSKTQVDWRVHGFGWRVMWGSAASLSAFLFLVFIVATKVLRAFLTSY
jgi:hypothetical protein